MTETYLYLLVAVLAVVMVHGIVSPKRFFEYPYFMAAAFFVFVLPQAFSLVRFPQGASPNAVETVLLMTLLCLLACLLGYRAPVSRWIVEQVQIPLDDRRLFRWGVFFVCCNFFFTYLISQMTAAERGGSMWTGRVTIFLFFANLGYPGLAICLTHAIKEKRNRAAWFWTVAGSLIPIVAGLIYGRREPTALFALTIALTLYYQKRYVVPRAAIAAALVGAMLVIPATGQYRSALRQEGLSGIQDIDFVGNFQRFLSRPAILELRNAAMMIEATRNTGSFGFGTAYWDQLVFRFVPAQIVGRELKESLMFKSSDEWLRQELAYLGYENPVGSTVTGMGDSFKEFGYFGALFFAVLAVVFKSLWQASLQPYGLFAQLLYIQTSTSAMRAATHQTVDYLPGLIYNLIFLGIAAYFSRVVRQPQKVASRPIGRTI